MLVRKDSSKTFRVRNSMNFVSNVTQVYEQKIHEDPDEFLESKETSNVRNLESKKSSNMRNLEIDIPGQETPQEPKSPALPNITLNVKSPVDLSSIQFRFNKEEADEIEEMGYEGSWNSEDGESREGKRERELGAFKQNDFGSSGDESPENMLKVPRNKLGKFNVVFKSLDLDEDDDEESLKGKFQSENQKMKIKDFYTMTNAEFEENQKRPSHAKLEHKTSLEGEIVLDPKFTTFKKIEVQNASEFRKKEENENIMNVNVVKLENEEEDEFEENESVHIQEMKIKKNLKFGDLNNFQNDNYNLKELFNLLILCKKTYSYRKEILKYLLVKISFLSKSMRDSIYRGIVDEEVSHESLLNFEKSTYTILSEREVKIPHYDKFSKKNAFKDKLNSNFFKSGKQKEKTIEVGKNIKSLDHAFRGRKLREEEDPDKLFRASPEDKSQINSMKKINEVSLSIITEVSGSTKKQLNENATEKEDFMKTSIVENEEYLQIKNGETSLHSIPDLGKVNHLLKKNPFGKSLQDFSQQSEVYSGRNSLSN